jgi:transposase
MFTRRTISYCVKDASGQKHREGKIGATGQELDSWMRILPQPWTVAMEATIFTGWIYAHLLPHAKQVKVAHPLMLRAIAAAKKKNDRIDAGKIADCLRCEFLPECHMASTAIRDRWPHLQDRKDLFCKPFLAVAEQAVQVAVPDTESTGFVCALGD